MNRTQRRLAERNERRGTVYTERVKPLPALLDEFTVFDMPQTIIDQLKNGAIDAANELQSCRVAFRLADRKAIASIARTAQIQIYLGH